MIDGRIRVMVAEVRGDKVRIGIDAPADVRIDRREVHERRTQGKRSPARSGSTGTLVGP
jgi:carbon storage regulator CsrA